MNKLTHVEGKIIVSIDLEAKNSVTFEDGTKIRLERKYDNFNMRYVNPVNAIVVSGESIPKGSQILIHHNAIHDTQKIFDYAPLSGKNEASDIKYFSISEDEAYAWYDNKLKEWKPLPGYDFALRVFKKYTGSIQGIEPELVKNVLFMLTGKYSKQAVFTAQASDYQIIFQDINGKEGNLIRIRTDGDEKTKREPEVIALMNGYTGKIWEGELLVGITKNDADLRESIQFKIKKAQEKIDPKWKNIRC